jgi:hypothetical protein
VNRAAEPISPAAPPTALAFADAVNPVEAAIPLPPRRPPAGPIEVAAGGWPLASLKPLPAPSRPEMDWPDPHDHRGVLRALLTAIGGGAAGRPSPEVIVLHARARPGRPSDPIGGLGPATTVVAGFSKSPAGMDLLRLAGPVAGPAAPAREANASP